MNGGAGLGQLLGMLIAAPVMACIDYFGWIKQQPAGQQELAKACHGIGILALVLWFFAAGGFSDFVFELATHPANPLAWLPLGLAAWGLAWFLINARFAAQSIGRPQRATMTVRALLKIGVGYAAWVGVHAAAASNASASPGWLALDSVPVWCFATGGTKLALMLWGGPRGKAHPMVERDIAEKEFDWDDGAMR